MDFLQQELKPAPSEARADTGVPGMDEILHGGLLRNHVYLIEGDPGAGKTTFALQFLREGARNGEKGLYITLSESASELRAVAASHGWSLDSLELFELIPVEGAMAPENQYTIFHPEEVELGETSKLIVDCFEKHKPVRVAIDSLAELRLLARDNMRYRRQILALKQYFNGKKTTVLLLDDRTAQTQERQLHSIVHGVIAMERLSRQYGKSRRRLEVAKMRGSSFIEGYHDYNIERGGLTAYPRLVAAHHHTEFTQEVISSSVEGLDALLGGGLERGSSTLLLGPSGCGKTTLATRYATAAVGRAEPVAFYTFDEGLSSLLARAESLGMPLKKYMQEDKVRVEQVDPAELSPGEFAMRVRRGVENGVQVVIIDSLNGYLSAMPEEQFLTLQMHELLTYLNQNGVVTILILAQQGILGQMQAAVDLSYLADTIVMLRFFEARGEVRRAVSVVKKRSGKHELTIREMEIDRPEGIRVGKPLTQFHGVLTGVPQFAGDEEGLQSRGDADRR